MNWTDTPRRVFQHGKKNWRDREASSYQSWLFERFHQPLVTTPPLSQCEVCVIVPVRNEADNLAGTLLSLYNQLDLTGKLLDRNRYEIVLLANNCSDESAAIARNFATTHPDLVLHVVEKTFPAAEAYIGRVRQVLMDEAYRRLSSIGGERRVIASTDGDSRVTPTWIAAILDEVASGADAVGGRIITDREGRTALDPYTRACHLREVGYRFLTAELETYIEPDPIDILPRHFQHYGASLAVTVEMYAQAGGMQPVRTPEDVAFYQALLRVNARFRHSTRVRVFTSARTTGRTDVGLANQLSKWVEMGRSQQQFLVESAAEVEARFEWRHQLRVLWWSYLYDYQPTNNAIALVANALGVNWLWLMSELAQPQTFGLLWEKVEQRQQVEGIWRQRWQLVPIQEAISALRIRLEKLRHQPSKPKVKSQKAKVKKVSFSTDTAFSYYHKIS
ncbi:glycosyltransferase [Chroococcidiopsis sp. FACHB-1243]|uniref:glycosyltransferase n=1 Tax=Chroococcidiopsis sp. [FACHB-1243] TaxID=2692781 RepID=UPI00178365DD|nr:glycosyltransferase family A protein [Chroococcidiopsis sp. [FACHB-1243]]MBD2305877.1 glycosyltransferase [Chroococcidiopsis sp. [FACHB-1243]]